MTVVSVRQQSTMEIMETLCVPTIPTALSVSCAVTSPPHAMENAVRFPQRFLGLPSDRCGACERLVERKKEIVIRRRSAGAPIEAAANLKRMTKRSYRTATPPYSHL